MKSSLLVPLLIIACRAARDEGHVDSNLNDSRRGEVLGGAIATVKQALLEVSGNICGGPTIPNLIGPKSDHSSVRSVNWEKVVTIADEYLAEESNRIRQLTSEVQVLQDKIEHQKHVESVVLMSEDAIINLIKPAVNSGYGEFKHAQESRCSDQAIRSIDASGRRIRVGTYAQMQESKAAFETGAGSYFEANQVKVDAASFQHTCMELLNPEKIDQSKTQCDEFCLMLGTIVQDASDHSAHTSGLNTVEDLSRQFEEKSAELKFAIDRESDCQRAKANLEAFKTELTSLSDEIASNWHSVQVAQDEFDEADMVFEDLQSDLAKQDESTKHFQALFAKNDEATMAAAAALQEVETKKQAVHSQLEHTLEEFVKAQQALSKASAADRAVNELTMAVSDTILDMLVYFDEAVRAPMLNLGFHIDMKVSDYFEKDMRSLDSAKDVVKSLEALSDVCENAAKPSFEELRDKVDLSPMCALGGTIEEISQGIDQAVLSRANLVQMNLETAMSFLNPYQGQKGMTSEKAQERVYAGELQGLPEVKSVFKTAPFWQYLQNWQLEGTFLPLYTKLGDALNELATAKAQVESAVEETFSNLQALVDQSMEARSILEHAVEALEASWELKADAEEALELLLQESEDQKELLSNLREASANAMKSYEQAKINLEKAHSEGLSGSMLEKAAVVRSIKKHP
mmetsp:Transcript_65692/g.147607  ORF Transcript_65692/g.147607 Transcript_65692/m.147607 type:complete len:687 (-) Transcript_65692:249-2309(-)